jgi:hypothetical protein
MEREREKHAKHTQLGSGEHPKSSRSIGFRFDVRNCDYESTTDYKQIRIGKSGVTMVKSGQEQSSDSAYQDVRHRRDN